MSSQEDSSNLSQIKGLLETHNSEARETAIRMDRLESKIEKLTDAVVAIARAEEKIATLVTTVNSIDDQVDHTVIRVNELEKDNILIKKSVSFNSKFFWVVITAAITSIATAIIL